MEVNSGCMPIQRAEADSSREYAAFLVFNGVWAGGFLRNSLKLRLGFGIIALEFHWSASGKVSKRAKMPFLNSNGKCELESDRTDNRQRGVNVRSNTGYYT